jgi:hypothetical protein
MDRCGRKQGQLCHSQTLPRLVAAEGGRPPPARPFVFALAGALCAGQPVAGPRARGMAALLHRHLMPRTPVWRTGGWRGGGCLAGRGRLAEARRLLGRQGLLHGLLDQGLHVGGW